MTWHKPLQLKERTSLTQWPWQQLFQQVSAHDSHKNYLLRVCVFYLFIHELCQRETSTAWWWDTNWNQSGSDLISSLLHVCSSTQNANVKVKRPVETKWAAAILLSNCGLCLTDQKTELVPATASEHSSPREETRQTLMYGEREQMRVQSRAQNKPETQGKKFIRGHNIGPK